MEKTKVLVVDDSVVIRRMLTDVLTSDPAMEVVGAAANGQIAVSRLEQWNPDVVILDLEMPVMDGLETLTAIRATHPRLPVIMFSSLTARGGVATLDALGRGATDYVTKPSQTSSMDEAKQRVRDELIPKIRAFCGIRVARQVATVARAASLPPAVVRRRPAIDTTVTVVAIGVSTGGPNALAEIIPLLPADLAVPVLIVQHMPPLFTRLLAERLSTRSTVRVSEAAPGMKIEPGHVYIAPGDWHMVVDRGSAGYRLWTHQGPQENSCRPSVDVLFRSCAESFGAGVLGVMLTGMGQDGLRGSHAVVDAGGRMVAQDEATSVVWGMPGFVVADGLADAVLPLAHIAGEIITRVQAHRLAGSTMSLRT